MDLLTKLEHALEGMFEGVFTRAFKAPLQPVEIAKRLAREMENHRTVSVNATYVPNAYTVHLAPGTFEEFQSFCNALLGEFEQYLRDFAEEHQYQTVGPMAVKFSLDESLKGSDTAIKAARDAQAIPSSTPPIATVLHSAPPSTEQPVSAPMAPAHDLEITAGEAQGTRVALAEGLTIGRGPQNSIALSQPGVSRRHAEITRVDGVMWAIHDLGSVNGTYVNTRRITAPTVIKPGDVINIGDTVIKVR